MAPSRGRAVPTKYWSPATSFISFVVALAFQAALRYMLAIARENARQARVLCLPDPVKAMCLI